MCEGCAALEVCGACWARSELAPGSPFGCPAHLSCPARAGHQPGMGLTLLLQLLGSSPCSGSLPGLHISLALGTAPADGKSSHSGEFWEITVSIFPLTQK